MLSKSLKAYYTGFMLTSIPGCFCIEVLKTVIK